MPSPFQTRRKSAGARSGNRMDVFPVGGGGVAGYFRFWPRIHAPLNKHSLMSS
jgi:hypothetical protein